MVCVVSMTRGTHGGQTGVEAMGDKGETQFGEEVRRLRQEKGISLRKFAVQVSMSPTYLSKVERGEFPPPAEEKVKAMARLLGQNEDEFLALAHRVASDLTGIIRERPKIMADFLRTMRGLPQDEMRRLLSQAEKAKEKATGQPPKGK